MAKLVEAPCGHTFDKETAEFEEILHCPECKTSWSEDDAIPDESENKEGQFVCPDDGTSLEKKKQVKCPECGELHLEDDLEEVPED